MQHSGKKVFLLINNFEFEHIKNKLVHSLTQAMKQLMPWILSSASSFKAADSVPTIKKATTNKQMKELKVAMVFLYLKSRQETECVTEVRTLYLSQVQNTGAVRFI